jgi:bisanhydrobacterioruberin hydratase
MEKKLYLKDINLTPRFILLGISSITVFTTGLLLIIIDRTRSQTVSYTEYFLILTGIVHLFQGLKRKYALQVIMLFIILSVIFFGIEYYGVKTGYIFGNYNYTDIFRFTYEKVPYVIGLNWVLVIAGGYLIGENIFSNFLSTSNFYFKKLTTIFFTGFYVLTFDWFLEPIAIKLGYWEWLGNYIPVQNYFSWFLLGIFGGILFTIFQLERKVYSFPFTLLFFLESVFFILLNIFLL